MEVLISHGIKISFTARFQHEILDEVTSQSVFVYDITIDNISDEVVQLISRHWIIFDSIDGYKEVEGDGVVGVQPVINPGASYTYSSWCPLSSGLGFMKGCYLMNRMSDNENLLVGIPVVQLHAPFILN